MLQGGGVQLSFGVGLGRDGADGGPVAAARAAEAAGFDVVTAPDHVGAPSPFVVLAAAAAVTERVRLRTYVLDVGFWNVGLLARDVATLDDLSGGRVEVGLGAGHMAHEHAVVGLPFPTYRERLEALDGFAGELAAHLADGDLAPAPAQQPVPIVLAAMSPSGLEVAARHGATVALSGLLQAEGRPGGTFTVATSEQTSQRVDQVRAARERLGLPPAAFDALVQQVVVDRDPEEAAGQTASGSDGVIDADVLLDSPFVLYARTPEDAAAELVARAERFGITSWCTHAPSGPAMAQVIRVLRA